MNEEKIEKPWVVYSEGIGKVVRKEENDKTWIVSFDSDLLELARVPKNVQIFKTPNEAINYFLNHQPFIPHILKNRLQKYF